MDIYRLRESDSWQPMEPFHAEYDPRTTGRMALALLAVITPAVFYALHRWWDRDGQLSIAFPYLCLGVPFYLAICYALTMATCKGRVRWIIADGEIIYESPTSIYGKSFRMPLSDFLKVEDDRDAQGDSESQFALCVSKTGVKHYFDTKRSGGIAFFHRLKQEQKRLDLVKSGEE